MIGAPILPTGAVCEGGALAAPVFVLTGGAGGMTGAVTVAVGAAGAGETATGGGATARKPACVSTIGDIGAGTQSSPSSTLPSVIANTAP